MKEPLRWGALLSRTAGGVPRLPRPGAGRTSRHPQLHHVPERGELGRDRLPGQPAGGSAGDEGAAVALVGDCTLGVGGGGFSYTNIDSISVGVVVRLDDMAAKGRSVTEVFDHFLAHPFLAPYLEGGVVTEYGCHLVAEGGMEMVGKIAMAGMVVVGDAAGLTLNTGLTVRGTDLAVGLGVPARRGSRHGPRRRGTPPRRAWPATARGCSPQTPAWTC